MHAAYHINLDFTIQTENLFGAFEIRGLGIWGFLTWSLWHWVLITWGFWPWSLFTAWPLAIMHLKDKFFQKQRFQKNKNGLICKLPCLFLKAFLCKNILLERNQKERKENSFIQLSKYGFLKSLIVKKICSTPKKYPQIWSLFIVLLAFFQKTKFEKWILFFLVIQLHLIWNK